MRAFGLLAACLFFSATALPATLDDDSKFGRQLAEEAKPKRKFCNTSMYALAGDYAYGARSPPRPAVSSATVKARAPRAPSARALCSACLGSS